MTTRRTSLAVLLCVVLLCACGANTPAPAIFAIEPSSPEPGALVLVLGEGLDPVEGVRLGTHTLEAFTSVNAGMVTATVPPDFAAGVSTLEVRLGGGRRAIAYVNVRASPPAVSAPATAPDSPPAVADSQPSDAPAPIATAPPRFVRPPTVPPPISVAPPGHARDKDAGRDEGRDKGERDGNDNGDRDLKKDQGPRRGHGR